MRISDWSSDVCSSDLGVHQRAERHRGEGVALDELRQLHRRLLLVLVVRRVREGQRVLQRAEAAPFLHQRQTQRRVHGERREARRRSEEHTSELQSLMRSSYAVFCLKKKKKHVYSDIYKDRDMLHTE